MGEVYLARDTRLQRDVAVKVLPAEFAESAFQPFHGRFAVELRGFIFGVTGSEIFGAEVVGQANFHYGVIVRKSPRGETGA